MFRTSKPPPCSHFWHCRWFLGRSTRQSAQARCPPLHCRNQSNSTSIKKPAPCSMTRTDEVYSNLIHWMRQRVEAEGAVEHNEVHRDLRKLHRRVLFRLHDLALLVHNHLSTWAGVLQSFTVTYFILLQGALNQHMQVSKGESQHACMHCN